MSNQKTVTVEMFTPDGAKIRITEYCSNPKDVDALLMWSRDAGLVPLEPKQPDVYEQEWISHVALRIQTNSNDTETPNVALYASNEKLEMKWLSIYLNKAGEIAEFEAASGVKLADMPVVPGALHLTRKDKKAREYLVALPSPILIERCTKTYGEEDNSERRHKLSRYMVRARQNGHNGA